MYGIVFIASSLDGFIAGQNDDLSWLNGIPEAEKEYYDFNKLLQDVDCVLMGRKTFQVVEKTGQWPYTKKVYVLSRTLKSLDQKFKEKAELISDELENIFKIFHKKGYNKIYIDGAQTIQECIKNGFVNEMILTTVSTLLGNGTKLFDNIDMLLDFKIDYTMKLNDQMMLTRYLNILNQIAF